MIKNPNIIFFKKSYTIIVNKFNYLNSIDVINYKNHEININKKKLNIFKYVGLFKQIYDMQKERYLFIKKNENYKLFYFNNCKKNNDLTDFSDFQVLMIDDNFYVLISKHNGFNDLSLNINVQFKVIDGLIYREIWKIELIYILVNDIIFSTFLNNEEKITSIYDNLNRIHKSVNNHYENQKEQIDWLNDEIQTLEKDSGKLDYRT